LNKVAPDYSSKIAEMDAKINDFISEYKPQIDKLTKEVAALENTISTIENKVNSLLNDVLKKQITGVIVQATECPVIGYLNTPFDVRSNLLAAYYGETTATMEFPSTSAADYVNGDTDFNQWTMRNINIIGNLTSIKGYFTQSPGRFVGKVNDQYEGNAGTLYLTVNPNTVNFEGVTLNLETSKENAAPIMLSPLQYSDRELTLGYTRSANNGFYEAKATLTEADIDKASLKIDYKTLEEDAKAMLKKKDKASIINFGATLLQNMQDVMPAYGVKASWIDGTEGVTHNLLSEYNLGACAVKPLSFVFMKDYKFTKFPGLDRLQSLVGKVIDKVNIKINLGLPDFSKYKGSITFKDIDIDMSKFTLEYDITKQFSDGTSQKYLVIANEAGEFGLKGPDGKLYVIDENGDFVPASADYERRFNTYTKELKIDFTDEVKDLVNELEDSINEEFGASSDLAKNITSLLNDVASLSKIDTNISKSITDAKNEIKTTINSYITRANNKLTSWMNNAHKALYITLVGGVDKKIGMLSQSVNLPTKVSGELTLVPTSYTLELLAPAYKKYVAVTDVFDSSRNPVDLETAKSMAAAANSGENMNQVFDGETTCKMNGQSGYIYEITYTAVDFAGKVALKKYYVQF